jgi:hypothetical protein
MLTRRQRRGGPPFGRFWLCLLTTLVFCFYVNYVPVHLATAIHLDDAVAAILGSVLHPHEHAEDPSEEQDDDHASHPFSDHALTFAVQKQTPVVAPLTVCLHSETSLHLHAPEEERSNPIVERIKPPGESPPDPLQPRAPPFA